MTAMLVRQADEAERFFLGVAQSASGRAWRDRLDERGSARALAIAQRLGVPELLARVLAGRGVEPDEAEAYLGPNVKRVLPAPAAEPDWSADPDPRRTLAFCETKTVWHPVGI